VGGCERGRESEGGRKTGRKRARERASEKVTEKEKERVHVDKGGSKRED